MGGLKVHDLLIIFTYIKLITFLSDYLSCSLLIIYHTYLTLTYALIGFHVQLSNINNYHAACWKRACTLPEVGLL